MTCHDQSTYRWQLWLRVSASRLFIHHHILNSFCSTFFSIWNDFPSMPEYRIRIIWMYNNSFSLTTPIRSQRQFKGIHIFSRSIFKISIDKSFLLAICLHLVRVFHVSSVVFTYQLIYRYKFTRERESKKSTKSLGMNSFDRFDAMKQLSEWHCRARDSWNDWVPSMWNDRH